MAAAGRFTEPRPLTKDELESARSRCERRFVAQRGEEGFVSYRKLYEEQRRAVDGVLQVTDNLAKLDADAVRTDPGAWQTLRYFSGPPISEEDLWTLVGRKFKRVPPELADAASAALGAAIDPIRFPWIAENRKPTEVEADRAAMSTAILLAATKLSTSRRGSASVLQEAAVSVALTGIGFDLDASRTDVGVLDVMARGAFSHERKVAGAKCDVPIRLKDGRLLAIECKVSNGPKNGWKRLHREVGGKAQTWRGHFGNQVVTGAVLGGSFDLSCLEKAQAEYGIFLVFEHDLARLTDFVVAAK